MCRWCVLAGVPHLLWRDVEQPQQHKHRVDGGGQVRAAICRQGAGSGELNSQVINTQHALPVVVGGSSPDTKASSTSQLLAACLTLLTSSRPSLVSKYCCCWPVVGTQAQRQASVSESGLLLLPSTATARGAVVYITCAGVGQLQQVVARVRLRRAFRRHQWVPCVPHGHSC